MKRDGCGEGRSESSKIEVACDDVWLYLFGGQGRHGTGDRRENDD